MDRIFPAAQEVFAISEGELNRAKQIHKDHVDEWMKKDGVQGVGITSSADAPGEAALLVYLIQGAEHPPIPPVIDGLRTRIREGTRFQVGGGDKGGRQGCRVPVNKPAAAKAAGHAD